MNENISFEFIMDPEFKIGGKCLILAGPYNLDKRITPRIITEKADKFFLGNSDKKLLELYTKERFRGIFNDEMIKPLLSKLMSEDKALFSNLSEDYKIIQEYLK